MFCICINTKTESMAWLSVFVENMIQKIRFVQIWHIKMKWHQNMGIYWLAFYIPA